MPDGPAAGHPARVVTGGNDRQAQATMRRPFSPGWPHPRGRGQSSSTSWSTAGKPSMAAVASWGIGPGRGGAACRNRTDDLLITSASGASPGTAGGRRARPFAHLRRNTERHPTPTVTGYRRIRRDHLVPSSAPRLSPSEASPTSRRAAPPEDQRARAGCTADALEPLPSTALGLADGPHVVEQRPT